MKKIKSMLGLLKQPKLEHLYQQLKQELCTAYQAKDDVWGGIILFCGIGLSSLLWILSILYQHFHDEDILAYSPERQQLHTTLSSHRLFTAPPRLNHQAFHLSYQLAGILFHLDAAQRAVMLKLPSGEMRSFHTGDVLADGVKIVDIQAFQVTLEKNGRHQTLKLDQYQRDFLSDKPKSGQSLF